MALDDPPADNAADAVRQTASLFVDSIAAVAGTASKNYVSPAVVQGLSSTPGKGNGSLTKDPSPAKGKGKGKKGKGKGKGKKGKKGKKGGKKGRTGKSSSLGKSAGSK